MATTYTTNKQLAQIATNDDVGTWGPVVNNNMAILDAALGAQVILTLSNANVALTSTQAQNQRLAFVGTLTADIAVTIPAGVAGVYFVNNSTSGAHQVYVVASGGTGPIVPQGHFSIVASDGANASLYSTTFQPFFRMQSPSLSIPSNTITPVSNYQSSDSQVTTSTVNTISGTFTVGSGDNGIYTLTAACSTIGSFETASVMIYQNSTIIAISSNPTPTDSNPIQLMCSTIIRLSAGDFVYAAFEQSNTSGNSDGVATLPYNHFAGVRVAV